MKIRKFKKKDTLSCADLIRKTYLKFNGSEYFNESAAKNYAEFFNTKSQSFKKIYSKFSESQIFFVAIQNDDIIGLIRGKKNKISNLFVDSEYHKKGIGNKLIKKFESEAIKLKFKEIKIKSSVYALPFYQKQNYKKTEGLINHQGLKAYPMKKILI